VTGLRRTPIRRRPQPDPVTPEVRGAVLLRDGGCLLARLEPAHVCRDAWGNHHDPADLSKLSLEHVKDQLRMGRRGASDPAHLVALCYAANDRVPSKAQRTMFREYLATVAEHTHVELQHGCPTCEDIRRRKPPRVA